MRRHEFEISVVLEAPFIFPSVKTLNFGVDIAELRNSENKLFIPHDQIRGLIREGLTNIGWDYTSQIFGMATGDIQSQSDGEGSLEPYRTRVFFEDLVECEVVGAGDELDAEDSLRNRISIGDDDVAKSGHLLYFQQKYLPKRQVRFLGRVVIFGSEQEANSFCEYAQDAMREWDAIGSMAGAGLGRVIDTQISRVVKDKFDPVEPETENFTWVFSIDRPFLIDADREVGNSFLGRDVIPGGVIKGALARNLELRGIDFDGLDFSNTSICHSSSSPPSSFSKFKPDKNSALIYDALFEDTASHEELVFQNDWKSSEEADDTIFEERVHTEINTDTHTAKEGNLYATIAVVPDATYSVQIRNAPKEISKYLSCGLDGVGKTHARLNHIGFEELADAVGDLPPDEFVVILKSDGYLEPSNGIQNTPFEHYLAFWQEVISNSVELLDFYAKQELRGGYQGKRFRRQHYEPFLITKAGSVFKLGVAKLNESEKDKLRSLIENGICKPNQDWKSCPFVPENGYGRIEICRPS